MSNIGKIVGALVVVFLLIVGYKFLVVDKESPDEGKSVVTEEFDTNGTQGENEEFLRVLNNLENVSLDKALFSQEAFARLHDFSLQLGEQPKGRQNPFRPVSALELELALSAGQQEAEVVEAVQ